MMSCEIEIGWAIHDLKETDKGIAKADGFFQKGIMMRGFLRDFLRRYSKLDCEHDCYDAKRLNAALDYLLDYLENQPIADSYNQFKKILLGQD